jgi:ferric-dicitrate binding protein FerR (iron transport regulator)
MTILDGALTHDMSSKEEQFKIWLDQYERGTISSSDRELLMEAVAQDRLDSLLNEELELQWSDDFRESKSHSGPVPFEQSAVFGLMRTESKQGHPSSASYRRMWWLAAAFFSCIIGLLGVWKPWVNGGDVLARVPKGYRQQSNQSESIQDVPLADGSMVKLTKGSTIYYPQRFEGNKREVYLQGDAFFQVTHMEGKIFSVHGYSVSAEVLGTSFWVRQDEAVGNAEVEVLSGKVRVSNNGYSEKNAESTPVVVTANQQVSYRHGAGGLKLTLADTLLPLHTPEVERILEEKQALRFKKATRLAEVLSVLSKVYGVEIGLSSPDLNNCLVTGDLSGQDLVKSIEMICLSIGTTYELKQTKIIISGSGCTLN